MRHSTPVDRSSEYASDSQISTNNLDYQSESEIEADDQNQDDSSESSGIEDLKFATSRNENVVLELSMDGLIRHLSSNWKDIVGYVTVFVSTFFIFIFFLKIINYFSNILF